MDKTRYIFNQNIFCYAHASFFLIKQFFLRANFACEVRKHIKQTFSIMISADGGNVPVAVFLISCNVIQLV